MYWTPIVRFIAAGIGIAVAALIVWHARRRPLFAFALLLILFSFIWRLLSAAFLDVLGPVYAIELFAEVGGTGASFIFSMAILVTLIVIAVILRQQSLQRAVASPMPIGENTGPTLGDVVFLISCSFLLLLYADLFRRGVIPLFEGMERFEYTEHHAGPLHVWLFEFGNLLTFFWGAIAVYPRIRGANTDVRFVGLLIVVFLYCLLTGHRFSAFYSFSAFFLFPRAVLYIHRIPPALASDKFIHRLLTSKAVVGLTVLLVICGVAFALVNSYLHVRSFEAGLALASLGQRVLVQPSELWFVTYDRVFIDGQRNLTHALEFLFINPIDPDRSTTSQYLMAMALGEARAARVIDGGVLYNGGFPEILFELFGPIFAWPAIVIFSCLFAVLVREVLLAIYEGRLLSAIAVMYVGYALFLTYLGGMLDYLVAVTFWIKVGIMTLILLLERDSCRRPRPLIPWLLTKSASQGLRP